MSSIIVKIGSVIIVIIATYETIDSHLFWENSQQS